LPAPLLKYSSGFFIHLKEEIVAVGPLANYARVCLNWLQPLNGLQPIHSKVFQDELLLLIKITHQIIRSELII